MRTFLNIFTILGYLMPTLSHVTFTNLKCGTMDRNYLTFEKCHIKAVNRTHKYIDIHINLLKKPVENITVTAKFMRHDHGYKPFFVDLTFNGCQFLKNQRQPIVKLFYEIYKNSSNINHTCPFDHDIILDHLWTGNIESGLLKFVPMVNGDYAIFSEWSTYNIARAFINMYIRISDRQTL
ncbi:uncharacterized protein LOC108145787 [Drosophila elegans]|uniref:uncharacterized protein LOC108145787 n=1 Tax=Drosophila elegans TaxID=30023 RepID=UPI0007E73E79|nr:uncharacterized protein LOC108145787 [Drosophila elegans]